MRRHRRRSGNPIQKVLPCSLKYLFSLVTANIEILYSSLCRFPGHRPHKPNPKPSESFAKKQEKQILASLLLLQPFLPYLLLLKVESVSKSDFILFYVHEPSTWLKARAVDRYILQFLVRNLCRSMSVNWRTAGRRLGLNHLSCRPHHDESRKASCLP